jgi:hypothetical protein
MPEQYIPQSEEEQKFGELVERIFSDPKFANSMRTNPERALKSAGYELSAKQRKALAKPNIYDKFETPELSVNISIVKPVVRILTKGTKPVVRVVTKGTQPAVSVVTGTIVAVRESTSPTLEVVGEKPTKAKRGRSASKRR